MSAPRMLYPVVGNLTGIAPSWGAGALAIFFHHGDAATFAGENGLHLGSPKYDRREGGYRFVEPLVEVEYLKPRDGWERCAA